MYKNQIDNLLLELERYIKELEQCVEWNYNSEQEPEEYESVIVSIMDDRGDYPYYYTTSAWRVGDIWISDNEIVNGVVFAWKPFPKPCKP